MKKIFIAVLLFLNIGLVNQAYASHEMGGDFEYDLLDSINRIYRIRLVLYRDCSGIPMQTQVTVNITFSNGCPTQTYTIPAKPQPPFGNIAVEVTPLCNPKPLTTCSSSGSSIKGTQRYLYEQVVQFPPGCGIANLSYTSCCRNVNSGPGSITTLAPSSSTATWIEAQINTDAKRGNNSIKFKNPPIPYICAGSLFRYNHYAIDDDGDSLVYSMYAPYVAANQAGVIYAPPLSAQKPFQMVESGIIFDQKTGQFQFTPTTPQTSIMGFLIREYRKIKGFFGQDSVIFVGSTVRDVQVSVTGPCTPIYLKGIVKDSVKNGNFIDSLNVDVCVTGKPLGIKWRINASGLPLDVKLNAEMLGLDPGWKDSTATFSYVSKKDSLQFRDTLWGSFTYNTPPKKIGCYPLIFNYGYCMNGFPTSGTFTATICFKDNTYTDKDTVYFCDGGLPPTVKVFGGDTFNWTPMTGIVYAASKGEVVKLAPPASTRYIVQSNLNVTVGCKKVDTVELIYVPKFTYTLTPKNDTICQKQQKQLNLVLSPTQAPYRVQWLNPLTLFDPTTFKQTDTSKNPIAIPSVTTEYVVDMTSRFECAIRDTIKVVVGGTEVNVKDTANRVIVCAGDTTKVKVDYVLPKICGQSTLLCEGPTTYNGYPGSVSFTTYPASTAVNCSINCYPSVFGADNPSASAKHRIIYKKSELNSMGITAGIIKSITLTPMQTAQNTYDNFVIRMGCINTTNANDNIVAFTVFNKKTISINAASDKQFDFDNNFDWDGNSNILIEISFKNATRTGNTVMNVRSTSGIGLNECAFYVPTVAGQDADNLTTPSGFSNRKPMIKFGVCKGSPWSPGLNIKWTASAGNTISNDTMRNPTVTVNQAGTFTSTVSGGYTCSGTGSVFIDIDTTFKPKANNDTFICTNAGIQLNITGSLGANPAATTYLWSSVPPNAGVSGANAFIRNPAVFVTQNTTFFVQIKNGPCIVYDTVLVTKQTSIPVNFTSTDPYCTSNTGKIRAIPPGDPTTYTYVWKKGAPPGTIVIPAGTKQDTLINLSAGTYNVTVTNTSGCIGSGVRTLTPQVITLGLDTVVKHLACFGDANGEIKVKVISGSPILPTKYTYAWSPAALPGDTVIKNLAGNSTYNVTVTDTATGCTGTIGAKILQPTKLNLDLDSFAVKCFGYSNGAINFKATGGVRVNSTVFDWSNGTTSGNTVLTFINGMPAGKYRVTVTDDNGCKAYDSATINQPTQLSLSMYKRDATVVAGQDGMVSCTPTGGTTPYDFNWSKVPTGVGYPLTRNNKVMDSLSLAVGNQVGKGWYFVTVTDDSGCVAFDSIKVNDINCKLGASFTIDSVKCFGASTGVITAYAYDTINPTTNLYKFNAVKFANITDTTNANSPDKFTPGVMNNLAAGYYKLYIQTNKGCDTLYDSLLVKEAPQINTVPVSMRPVSCPGFTDGKAKVNVTGGTPPYTYAWNTPSATPTLDTTSGLKSGFNVVTVTDNNSCVKIDSVMISSPPQLLASLQQDSVSCIGLSDGRAYVSVIGGGTPPYTYLWDNGDADSIAQNVPIDTYTVVIKDNSYAKCSITRSIIVLQPDSIRLSLTKTDVSCNGLADGRINAFSTGGNGGKIFNLQPGNIDDVTGVFSGLTANAAYTVKVTDSKGCNATKNISIIEPPLITFNTGAKNASCVESANGKAWVSNVAGGTGSTYFYSWSTTPAQTADTARNLTGNVQYTVTVTDQNGCSVSKNQFVGVDYVLTIDKIATTDAKCNGASDGTATVTMLNGFAPFSYAWSVPGAVNSNVASSISAGNYTVSVTDLNSCTATGAFTIGEPDAITVTLESVSTSCFGYSDGKLRSTYSGGTKPYIKFEWNTVPPQFTDSAVNLKAGTYTIVITDSNNCTGTATGTVDQPEEFSVILKEQKHITCYELNDGRLSVTTKGGTSPYTFLWNTNPPRNTFTIDNLTDSKAYVVTATDANGCFATGSYEIKRPEQLNFEQVLIDSISCPNYKDGIIDIHAIGGTISLNKLYEYSIDGKEFVRLGKFTNLAKGRYSVWIRDNNGCTARREVELFEPERLFVDIVPADTSIDLGKTVLLTNVKRTVSGNIPVINYLKWYPSEGISCTDCESPLAEGYESRRYRLIYNYLNSCEDTTYGMVRVKDPLDFFVPSAFTPGNHDGLGVNDLFMVYGNAMKRVNMIVFNRWGEKIFESNNYESGWDGTYKGEPQVPGVYTYSVEVEYLNGKKKSKKGSVTLIR